MAFQLNDMYPGLSLQKEENNFNPPIKIERYSCGRKETSVISDQFLKAGTKQRALADFLLAQFPDRSTNLIYVGPSNGAGQLALATVGTALGYPVHLFLYGPEGQPLLERSRASGAVVENWPPPDYKLAYQAAEQFKVGHPKTHEFEFGLGNSLFIDYLEKAIRQSWPVGVAPPKRMWIACGSGTLLKALLRIFPDTLFLAVEVGCKLKEDLVGLLNVKVYNYHQLQEKKFNQFVPPASRPPYASILNYDAKAWHLFCLYGQNGDYIWNVAG